MDPLSGVLSLLKPRSYGLRGLNAGGDWALAYAADDGLKCFAITVGECWLSVDGIADSVRLAVGDFVLLAGSRAFRLHGGVEVPPIDAFRFFPTVPAGEVATLNGGGGCAGIGGYFGFDGMHAGLLLATLPPIVHIDNDPADRAALRWSVERLMRELREPQPGSSLLAEHLAQSLLIEALRVLMMDRSGRRTGWLFALADRQMRVVIAAMHEEPSRKWTLAALARLAGMSRSSFAVRFKETVGEPAMDYLTRWRIMVAAARLADGVPITIVAPFVGYQSESAFGAAFKRVLGRPPRQFAKSPSGTSRSDTTPV